MNRRRYNWGYLAEPEPGLDNRRLDCPRGRGLGGSSAINGMVYVRGHPMDFERWSALAGEASDWSYAAVLPYFRKAEGCADDAPDERYRGRSGPLITQNGRLGNPLYRRFIEAGADAGYAVSDDLNGFRQEAVGALPMTVARGVRCSAARALPPARQRARKPARGHWRHRGALRGAGPASRLADLAAGTAADQHHHPPGTGALRRAPSNHPVSFSARVSDPPDCSIASAYPWLQICLSARI